MKQYKDYKEICIIGQGAFGRVYKAANQAGSVVAIKQIKFQNNQQGIPSTALREISLLKNLKQHPNIVPLLDVKYYPKQRVLQLIFQFCQYDLKKYLQIRDKLKQSQIRDFLRQILVGVQYCHSKKFLHRDMKPPNILIDKQGNAKIADFGLGRALMIPLKTLTLQIQTLWYRAPQILLGQKKYTFGVDMWAIGCIFAQMALKKPIFLGTGYQIQQIFKIFEVMGTPTVEYWPKVKQLSEFKGTFPKWNRKPLGTVVPQFSPQALDLLQKMLQINPQKRITASQALKHEFFYKEY